MADAYKELLLSTHISAISSIKGQAALYTVNTKVGGDFTGQRGRDCKYHNAICISDTDGRRMLVAGVPAAKRCAKRLDIKRIGNNINF